MEDSELVGLFDCFEIESVRVDLQGYIQDIIQNRFPVWKKQAFARNKPGTIQARTFLIHLIRQHLEDVKGMNPEHVAQVSRYLMNLSPESSLFL